jgi:hypothetical protein
MKPFKISHHKQKNRFKWLNWIALGLGLIYLYWAADVYFNENDVFGATTNLILGLFWLASGHVNLFWIDPPMPDILLDENGITVDEKLRSLTQSNNIKFSSKY